MCQRADSPLRLLTRSTIITFVITQGSASRASLSGPHITTCSSLAESQCPSSWSLPTLGEHHYALPTAIVTPTTRTLTTQCACSTSICSSHYSGNADYRQQRNNSNLLPLPATAALRPPQNQSRCLDGNCTPQNSSAPSSGCIHSPFNNDDDSAHVPDAGGGSTPTPTNPFPFLALIVGSLALLWVWAIEETVILWPRLRLRSGTLDEMAMGREKGGCRCRVCTLRMQAHGQPLHDVKDDMA